MQRTTAQVIRLHGDNAVVQAFAASVCTNCELHGTCSTMAGGDGDDDMIVEALNPVHAEVGDVVELTLPTGGLTLVASLLYLFPALAAILGAALGSALSSSLGMDSDLAALLFLAVGLVVALVVLRILHPRLARRRLLRMAITDVVSGDPARSCAAKLLEGVELG